MTQTTVKGPVAALGPTRVLKLKEPIAWGSEVISELEVRKPRAKHVRNLPQEPKAGDLLDLAAALCGQTPRVIDELSIEDMQALLEVVGGFLGSGPATGSSV